MCLSEYLLFRYEKRPVDLVTAPQGNPEELAKAQTLVDQASNAVDEVLNALEAQKAAAAQAKRDEEASEKKGEELVVAKRELEAALEEVKAQEAAYNSKTAELEAKVEAGGVSGLRAKNELAQVFHLPPSLYLLPAATLTVSMTSGYETN